MLPDTSLMEGLDVLKGKSVFYWTRTCSNSCPWHQLHSLRYLKFGAFSSHIHFGFIILKDSTSSRLLLSLCCLFIFIRWPHLLNSQRERKSFCGFSDHSPTPKCKFPSIPILFFSLILVLEETTSLLYKGGTVIQVLHPRDSFYLSPFCIFSSLSYVSSLFHCLLFHTSGPHPGITCLSPQGICQCLETSLIVTMGGYWSGTQAGGYWLPAHQGHGCS